MSVYRLQLHSKLISVFICITLASSSITSAAASPIKNFETETGLTSHNTVGEFGWSQLNLYDSQLEGIKSDWMPSLDEKVLDDVEKYYEIMKRTRKSFVQFGSDEIDIYTHRIYDENVVIDSRPIKLELLLGNTGQNELELQGEEPEFIIGKFNFYPTQPRKKSAGYISSETAENTVKNYAKNLMSQGEPDMNTAALEMFTADQTSDSGHTATLLSKYFRTSAGFETPPELTANIRNASNIFSPTSVTTYVFSTSSGSENTSTTTSTSDTIAASRSADSSPHFTSNSSVGSLSHATPKPIDGGDTTLAGGPISRAQSSAANDSRSILGVRSFTAGSPEQTFSLPIELPNTSAPPATFGPVSWASHAPLTVTLSIGSLQSTSLGPLDSSGEGAGGASTWTSHGATWFGGTEGSKGLQTTTTSAGSRSEHWPGTRPGSAAETSPGTSSAVKATTTVPESGSESGAQNASGRSVTPSQPAFPSQTAKLLPSTSPGQQSARSSPGPIFETDTDLFDSTYSDDSERPSTSASVSSVVSTAPGRTVQIGRTEGGARSATSWTSSWASARNLGSSSAEGLTTGTGRFEISGWSTGVNPTSARGTAANLSRADTQAHASVPHYIITNMATSVPISSLTSWTGAITQSSDIKFQVPTTALVSAKGYVDTQQRTLLASGTATSTQGATGISTKAVTSSAAGSAQTSSPGSGLVNLARSTQSISPETATYVPFIGKSDTASSALTSTIVSSPPLATTIEATMTNLDLVSETATDASYSISNLQLSSSVQIEDFDSSSQTFSLSQVPSFVNLSSTVTLSDTEVATASNTDLSRTWSGIVAASNIIVWTSGSDAGNSSFERLSTSSSDTYDGSNLSVTMDTATATALGHVNSSEYDISFSESVLQSPDFTTFALEGFTTQQEEHWSEVVVQKATAKSAGDGLFPVSTTLAHIQTPQQGPVTQELSDATTPELSGDGREVTSSAWFSRTSIATLIQTSEILTQKETLSAISNASTISLSAISSSPPQATKGITKLVDISSSAISINPTVVSSSAYFPDTIALVSGKLYSESSTSPLYSSPLINVKSTMPLAVLTSPGVSKTESNISKSWNVTDTAENSSNILQSSAYIGWELQGTSSGTYAPSMPFIFTTPSESLPWMILTGLESLGPVQVLVNSISMGVPLWDKLSRLRPFPGFEIVIPAGAWKSDRRRIGVLNPLTVTVYKPPANFRFPGQVCGLAIDMGPHTQQLAKPISISLPCKWNQTDARWVVRALSLDPVSRRWTTDSVSESWNVSDGNPVIWANTQSLGTHMAIFVFDSSDSGLNPFVGIIIGVTVGTAVVISAIVFAFRRRLGCGNPGQFIWASFPSRRRRISARLGFYVTSPDSERVWVNAASATPENIEQLKLHPEIQIIVPCESLEAPVGPDSARAYKEIREPDSVDGQLIDSDLDCGRHVQSHDLEMLHESRDFLQETRHSQAKDLDLRNSFVDPKILHNPYLADPAKLDSWSESVPVPSSSSSMRSGCTESGTIYFGKKSSLLSSLLMHSKDTASELIPGPGPVSGSSTQSVPDNLSRGESLSVPSEGMSAHSGEEITVAAVDAMPTPNNTCSNVEFDQSRDIMMTSLRIDDDSHAACACESPVACEQSNGEGGSRTAESPLAISDPASEDSSWPSTPLACLASLSEFWKYPLPTIQEPAYREDMSEPPTMALDPKDFTFLRDT